MFSVVLSAVLCVMRVVGRLRVLQKLTVFLISTLF